MFADGKPRANRIVCRLPNWVGDAVMVTPALRALRRAYPEAHFTVHCRPPLVQLLEGSGLFDEWIPVAKKGRGSARANSRALAAVGADLAFVFPHSFRTAWEVYRAGVPIRMGYAREMRSWLLTHALPPHRHGRKIFPVPMVLQYLELVALVGAQGDGRGPELGIPEPVRQAGEQALIDLGVTAADRLVAFNPGASFGPSKIWPVEYVAEAADQFQDRGYRALILCGPGEETLANEIAAAMRTQPINTASQMLPLDQLKVALQRSDLVVTTDTGPRHLAVAMGTPTICLMGSTDHRYTNSHLGNSMILRRDVPCGPCHLKVCPIDHKCMRQILPREVVEHGEQMIAQESLDVGD